MCEGSERVESPGTYVTDRPPMLWWLSHGEGVGCRYMMPVG